MDDSDLTPAQQSGMRAVLDRLDDQNTQLDHIPQGGRVPGVGGGVEHHLRQDQVLSVNLTGAVSTLVASLPHVPDGGSLLVSGSSMAIRPREGRLAYVAAKAGLHGAALALALELAPRRIRVNVLAPV